MFVWEYPDGFRGVWEEWPLGTRRETKPCATVKEAMDEMFRAGKERIKSEWTNAAPGTVGAMTPKRKIGFK